MLIYPELHHCNPVNLLPLLGQRRFIHSIQCWESGMSPESRRLTTDAAEKRNKMKTLRHGNSETKDDTERYLNKCVESKQSGR